MDNLTNILNNSQFVFYFLVVDEYLDIDLYPTLTNFHVIYAYSGNKDSRLGAKKAPYFCLEDKGIVLPEKNSGRLLSDPNVVQYILDTSAGKTAAIIPFKPSAKIELICQKNNWKLISNQAGINRELEDKMKFFELASKQNLPLIPSHICKFTQENFADSQQRFGPRLVVQTHFGWAGKSTYTFSNWKEASQKLTEGTTVKISPFLSGYSLLNNCCLTRFGLLQSPPALQFTGLPEYTANPFSTVGRQWPSLAPAHIQNQVREITQKFTDTILAPMNYKGFFGLDFFVDDQQNVYLLECNPRLTASFAFYTSIELQNNLTPLFFYHLLELSGINYSMDINTEQARFDNPGIIGAEITPKDSDSNTIYKYNSFSTFTESLNPITIKDSVKEILNNITHAL